MQAWGYDSRYGRRDTFRFPTRSGLFGLLAAARGIGGDAREFLSTLQPVGVAVCAFPPAQTGPDGKGRASELPVIIEDFQMVGSAYDLNDPWESLMRPRTSDGKRPVGEGTKMTFRYYLADMAYGAVLACEEELAVVLFDALQKPVWDLYLGRKACVPTETIAHGVHEDLEKAHTALYQTAQSKGRIPSQWLMESAPDNGLFEDEQVLNDVPVAFGGHPSYAPRKVYICGAE